MTEISNSLNDYKLTSRQQAQLVADWVGERMILDSALGKLAEAQAALVDEPGNVLLRDGAIKRFEMAYDLVIRRLRNMLKRRLPNAKRLGQHRTILLCERDGLLNNPTAWRRYTKWREQKAVEYARDENRYAAVIDDIPNFIRDARKLLRPVSTTQPFRNQHQVAEHEREGTYVEGYLRGDGTPVAGHHRSGGPVRCHVRKNRR